MGTLFPLFRLGESARVRKQRGARCDLRFRTIALIDVALLFSIFDKRVNCFYRNKGFEVVTVSGINFMNIIVYHCGNEQIVKDGLGFGFVLCDKSYQDIRSLRCWNNYFNILLIFYKIQRVLSPLLVSRGAQPVSCQL